MKISRHIQVSLLASAIIFATGHRILDAALFFCSGVLIDVDHYLDYVFKFKRLGLIAAYRYNVEFCLQVRKEPKKHYCLHCFHTVEFIAVILIICAVIKNYFLFYGLMLHHLLDFIEMSRYRIFFAREISVLRYLVLITKKRVPASNHP